MLVFSSFFSSVFLIPHCRAGSNYKAEHASFLLLFRRVLRDSSPFLICAASSSPQPPPGDLLLAACQSADHCICLSAEYQLINAFTATINKTAERLLSLIERYSWGCIGPNEEDTCSGDL